MRRSIAEVLEEIIKLKKNEDKVEALRRADHPVLRDLLQYAYHPGVKWLVPTGTPPYRPAEVLDIEGRLFNEARRLYLFVEGGHPTLAQDRREKLFIQFLESLNPRDAELIIQIKDRKIKGITEKLVREAFPGLLGDEQVGTEEVQ